MDGRTPVPAALPAFALLIVVLSYISYKYLVLRQERHDFRTRFQCKDPTSAYPHAALLQGLDFVYENARNIFARRFTLGVHQRFQRYGPTHVSHIFWGGMVNTIDPVNLESAMTTDCESWTIIPQRADLVVKLFGKGIFANEGNDWKHSRSLMRRGMTNLADQPDVLERHVKVLLGAIKSHHGDTFDFSVEAFRYSFYVAKDLLIGQLPDADSSESESAASDTQRQFAVDFGTLVDIGRTLTLLNRRLPYAANVLFRSTFTPAKTRVWADVDVQTKIALQGRTQKDEQSRHPKSLVGRLAHQIDDVSEIRSEALNMLLAGRDSVGIALSETFYLLARHPQVWSRLRTEVGAVCGGRAPAPATLKSMMYLNSVINEVLRLRPTLSVHGRRAIRDTCLPRGGGPDGLEPLFVTQGTYLVYSNYSLHRNPAVFGTDVDDFRPERWESIAPKRFEYMSFGGGVRRCPGRNMAWMMLAYSITRLAQSVEQIEARDDQPWEEGIAFSYFNVHGAKLAMSVGGGIAAQGS